MTHYKIPLDLPLKKGGTCCPTENRQSPREGGEARREGTASPCSWRRAALSPLPARFLTSPSPRPPRRGRRGGNKGGVLGVLLLVTVLLAACGGGGGSPPSGAQTVAYIVTSCSQTGGTMTLQQELRILRGEAEAVTVMSVGPLGPFPSIACNALGFYRRYFYLSYGPLQRLGITPDGSGIVYELTDEFVSDGRGLLPQEQRGIYYMRADGSGLRRLGPASRSPSVFSGWHEVAFGFDPSGLEFTYIDRGPDEAGHDAAQVFVQGLTSGAPSRQVTRLPALDFPGLFPENAWPFFVDARTIAFSRFTQPPAEYKGMWVDADGTVQGEWSPVVLPGGQVIPVFQIVGGDWGAGTALLPGDPVNGSDAQSNEVFVWDGTGTNSLQLTSFRRVDTALFPGFYSARDERVYFPASADPFGTNPSENCQIFSIDPLGSDLRQLTFFRESAAHAANGCFGGPRPNGCRIDFSWSASKPSQDPHTGTIFFKSTCDPFGQNPNGWQLFAMQPDGSGLRQLTNARGFVSVARTSEVESVDAFWSAPYE